MGSAQSKGSSAASNDDLKTNAMRGVTAPDITMDLSNSGSLKRKAFTSTDESGGGEDESTTKTQQDQEQTQVSGNKRHPRNDWKEHSSFIAKRHEDRLRGISPLNQCQPRDFLTRAIRANESSNPDYARELRDLPPAKPTPAQLAVLEKSASSAPNYLGRTASLGPGFRFDTQKRGTNGYTTQNVMMPAADTYEDEGVHSQLQDMSQGEILFMVGQHLLWNDVRYDEFLSYSEDPLMLVVHALNRYHEGQRKVTMQFLDLRTVRNTKYEPAAFYKALSFYEAFDVPNWSGWSNPNRESLRARKFTHEYLSHGTTVVNDTRFMQASIEDLIRDGLYKIFPKFKVPDNHKRTGLYTGQVHFRKVGYPLIHKGQPATNGRVYSNSPCSRSKRLTFEFLKQVQTLTRNFGEKNVEPHLYVFLAFLTFEKRRTQDLVFLEWIKTHYTREDVKDIYDDGAGGVLPDFTHVAENLPGVIQLIDLIRDAGLAFGLLDLVETVVETKNTLTREIYADDDARLHRKSTSSFRYRRRKQIQLRKKQAESRKRKAEHTSHKKRIRQT